MPRLSVAALIAGEPGPLELWTLRELSRVQDIALTVVQARSAARLPRSARALALLRRHGAAVTLSRLAGSFVAAREAARDRALLEELLDFPELSAWWAPRAASAVPVSTLNAEDSVAALRALDPDVVVRVSGGVLKPEVLARARVAALNLHHGRAPMIRGVWSIGWGVVEGRPDWIGATVHVMDAGIDTGPVLWRGSPQLAAGDTATDLLFRAHLEGARALADVVARYARGERPKPLPSPPPEASVYRTTPGLGAWLRYLRLERGRRSRALLERSLEC